MNKPDVKKLILLNLPYVFAFYFADKIAAVFRLAPGTEFIDKLTNGFAVFGSAFANPLPSFHPVDLLVGLVAGALLKLAVYVKGKNRKKFRQGEEYGSARWGKPEDIKPYMDPEFSNNVILTQTEYLTMNSRPKQPKYARNKNILVIGGSGSGKTRFFVKPNLMQMHSSYVVTDPKGTVLVECGKMLEKGGYVIKSLNTINFRKSMHYNPFSYIRSEKDILKLVNTIIVNTKGDGDKSGEDFWVKAEKLYYTALIGYIWYEAPDHEKNFTTLLEMINASEAREDDETFKNPVDVMFDELEARDPDHFAVKQYRKYKLAAGVAAVCPRNIAYIQGRRRDRNAAAAAEEHVSKLLRRGGQHTDFFITAVGGGVHIGEGTIGGKGVVPSNIHESRDRQQQCEEHGKGGHSLFPAQPQLQSLPPSQGKAEDHGNQRQQEEQDLQQILADPIEKLRVEIDDHISAHADLADGHEISEDAVIDQLHLGQQHLCRDQENPCDLAQNLWQA